jgi:cell division protein FtsB
MYLIPAGFILFILFFTVFGERGLLSIHHLREEKQSLEKKAEELKTENEKLKREIEALRNDRRYLESIARRDFGLVRPNEVIYQFSTGEKADVQPSPAAPAPAGSAPPAAGKKH